MQCKLVRDGDWGNETGRFRDKDNARRQKTEKTTEEKDKQKERDTDRSSDNNQDGAPPAAAPVQPGDARDGEDRLLLI